MKTDVLIRDLSDGDDFEGFYILSAAQLRTTSANKPFLSMKLTDRSGEIDAKMWDYAGDLSQSDVGKVVKIRGTVETYNDALQIRARRLRLANESDPVNPEELVPTAPIDADAAMEELCGIVAGISDPDYRGVAETILARHKDALRTLPAAKRFHHSFRSGLLMHTLNMLRLADFLSELYAPVIDRSLLLAGTCLHDIAKDREFSVSELGIVTDYSVPGKLIGHLVLGAQEVAQVASEQGIPEEKSLLLQHMILSHHGEHEFGAAVLPVCAESELLSYIDRIDSRMEIYEEVLERIPAGTFSERIQPLDKQIYSHDISGED